MAELEIIVKKKDEVMQGADVHLDEKVNDMYDMCYRWRSAAAALPVIIGRLKSLKALHQYAGTFASRLAVLEKQQTEIIKLVESSNQALVNVQKAMVENAGTMQRDVETLSQRIKNLTEKA
eukprot:Platyproteum_vivax@DN5973_c0_g1_i2.p1